MNYALSRMATAASVCAVAPLASWPASDLEERTMRFISSSWLSAVTRLGLLPKRRQKAAGRAICGEYSRRLAVELLEDRRLLAMVTVTNTSEVVDGNTTSISNLIANKGADGTISLREAIDAADNTSGGDEVQFSLGDGNHTIQLSTVEDTIE